MVLFVTTRRRLQRVTSQIELIAETLIITRPFPAGRILVDRAADLSQTRRIGPPDARTQKTLAAWLRKDSSFHAR